MTELGLDASELYHMSRGQQLELIDQVTDEVLSNQDIGELAKLMELSSSVTQNFSIKTTQEQFEKPNNNDTIQLDGLTIDAHRVLQEAKDGKRHGGVYREAQKKTENQLRKSYISRRKRVLEHQELIADPTQKIPNWHTLSKEEQQWIINTWESHIMRNAEQATIEEAVYKERFCNE